MCNSSSQGLSFESLVPCESVQDTTWVFCANSVALPGIKYSTNIPLNSIALHYGFQAEEQFGDTLGDYVSRGHDVGTCTGTCSWSTLTGSPELAMSNGHSAARASHRLGPLTLSVTSHWSSHPSLGHLTFALPGFLIGAGHSWNSTTPMTYVDTVLSDLVDAHLLGEWANLQPPGEGPSTSSVGKVLVDLGRAESWLNTSAANSTPTPSSSVLLSVLSDPDGLFDLVKSGLDPNEWNEAIKRIKKCQASLLKCPTPTSPTTENFRHEVFLSSELLLLAARLGRSLVVEASNKGQTSVPISALTSTFRTDIANKILGLAEQFKALWLSQCEPSGLQGALQVLTNLINALIPTTKGMPPAV